MNIYKFIFVVVLVSSSLYSQPQWEQLNSGVSTNLRDLCFLSDDVGWVVGYNGVIIKTTDGGTTWNQQTSNTNLDLLSVYFIDEQHGWIGGTSGLLLTTTNGGEEWNSSTIAYSDEKVYCVEFVDENTGYAIVGYVDYYGNYYGYILKTSDGGNSWLSKFNIYYDALINVFTRGDHAWVVGTGVEAYTTNYGEYWNLIYTPGDQWLFDVYFYNDTTGYAVGGNDNTEIIIKTTNGGSFWDISKETHPYARLIGVYFTDVNRGWAVGWNGRILYTTDGGSTWIPQSSPVNTPLRKVQFTARNTGYIVGEDGVILKYSEYSDPITVIDPNGGEIISAGSDYYIEWNSTDVADVKLDYSTDNGSTWITIVDSIPSTGIYDWTVPNTFTSLGRVRISDITDPTVFDISDGPFTIQSSHTITVTDPNGGEELQGGSTYEINWSSNDVEYVKIEYSINNGATWNLVDDSVESTGAYLWNVPNVLTIQGRIKISDLSIPSVYDVSNDPFRINYVSNVDDETNITQYELLQNYPNPFNPTTTLSYQLPQAGFVILKVYDVLGDEIETLVNEEKPAGIYKLTWIAENLPGGVYFYRIQTESYMKTRKMILLK